MQQSVKIPRGFYDAMRALYGPHKPMTPDEIAAHMSNTAKVRAADDRRREPTPQLELPT